MELQNTAATPLVTVVCTTYNHEQFIAQTIDGFLAQQCSYPWQILIHDDASTDGTAQIVAQYAAQHPDRIRTILQTENQYSKGENIWQTLFCDEVTSRYIAICEGDDYWTDPLKLQKQLDIMESDTHYGMTYTQARTFNQNVQKQGAVIGRAASCFAGILCVNPVPTLTTLFRRDLAVAYFAAIQPTVQGWKMGDYPLWLYIAAHSKVHYLAEVVAVYRVLPNSASHSHELSKKVQFSKSTTDIKLFFANKYAPSSVEQVKVTGLYERLELYCQAGDREKAFEVRNELIKIKQKAGSFRLHLTIALSRCPELYYATLRVMRYLKSR